MKLTHEEITEFYHIWYALMWNLNEKYNIVEKFEKPTLGEAVDATPIYEVRNKLWENPEWLDDLTQNNTDEDFTSEHLQIIQQWRKYFVKDKFLIMKNLKKHSVFMTFSNPTKLYGVHGLISGIEEMIPFSLPVMVRTVLLPFKGKIVYDTFMENNPVTFGGNMKAGFNEDYKEAKEKTGIIIDMNQIPTPQKKKQTKKTDSVAVDTKGANVPKAMSAKYMEIAPLIEKFADESLNEEYKELCLKALAKLCRKRPSPVVKGRANTWACGIVYAIGQNNFIFDKSQPINMTATEIADGFGIAKSTAGSKAKEVTDLLGLSYFDTEFLLNSLMDKNPMIWYLEVNGMLVDIRRMPYDVQLQAYEQGLIPYIPMDRE